MAPSISVVINTLNDEARIGQALQSVDWADEVIVCDMHSEDKTVEIARKMGAKIVNLPFSRQEFRSYVESMVNAQR